MYGGGLFFGEWSQVESHGDAVQEVSMERLPEGLP